MLEGMGDISQVVTFDDVESLYIILDIQPLLWIRFGIRGSLSSRSHSRMVIGGRWGVALTNGPTKLVERLDVTAGNGMCSVADRIVLAVAGVSNEVVGMLGVCKGPWGAARTLPDQAVRRRKVGRFQGGGTKDTI